MDSFRKMPILWLLFVAMVLTLFLMEAQDQPTPPQRADISAVIAGVERHEIGWVRIRGNAVTALPKGGGRAIQAYSGDPRLLREALVRNRVPFQDVPPPDDSGLSNILWIGLFLLATVFILRLILAARGAGGGGFPQAFTKNKSKMMEHVTERFTDVAGIPEAVEDVQDIVEFLRAPEKFQRLGGRMPKGTLLVGAPGTGKTLLARALAGEAGVPFFFISGSQFVEMFVGVGAARVRDLFEQAKKAAPCIVFIDEIDALGKRENEMGLGGGHSEKTQTLNEILVAMDGFEPNTGVIVLGATNQPEALDKALVRAGRFDRRVVVNPPDLNGRAAILAVHIRRHGVKVHADLVADPKTPGVFPPALTLVARNTSGLVGADLESLVNEAALLATKRNKDAVETVDFLNSIETVVAGKERKGKLMSALERRTVAWHEAGHAIVGHMLPDADPVTKISIIPRGQALGYTMSLPEEDRVLYHAEYIRTRIKVLFGGRVAEEMLHGPANITSGASDDYARLTDLATRMVTEWGMSPDLGDRTFGVHHHSHLGSRSERNYSERTARTIDEQVSRITTECKAAVRAMLERYRPLLEQLANALLVEETVDGDRVTAILGPRPAPVGAPLLTPPPT